MGIEKMRHWVFRYFMEIVKRRKTTQKNISDSATSFFIYRVIKANKIELVLKDYIQQFNQTNLLSC